MVNERKTQVELGGVMSEPIVTPLGFSHMRLTVTDIRRSKAFYE